MKIQARSSDLVVQTAGDETIVYDLTTHRAFLLNETTAFVWQMCDGTNDIEDITIKLARKTREAISKDVVKLSVDMLRENDLLKEDEPVKNFYSNTNRRQVIKQIGLASMIALPGIFALTAPTAANAVSVAAGGGGGAVPLNLAACDFCSQNSDCASGKCFGNATGSGKLCSDGESYFGLTYTPGRRLIITAEGQTCDSLSVKSRCCSNRTFTIGAECYCDD